MVTMKELFEAVTLSIEHNNLIVRCPDKASLRLAEDYSEKLIVCAYAMGLDWLILEWPEIKPLRMPINDRMIDYLNRLHSIKYLNRLHNRS